MLCTATSRRPASSSSQAPGPPRAHLRAQAQNRSRRAKTKSYERSCSAKRVFCRKSQGKKSLRRQTDQRHYHRNQQYSVNALTDPSGNVKERYAYTAYGGLSVFDRVGMAIAATSEGNRYTYTGREWDEELRIYHYRARMYDPVSGRFMGRDPVGFASGSLSLYTYVHNAPPHFLDPSGEWSLVQVVAVVVVVVVVVAITVDIIRSMPDANSPPPYIAPPSHIFTSPLVPPFEIPPRHPSIQPFDIRQDELVTLDEMLPWGDYSTNCHGHAFHDGNPDPDPQGAPEGPTPGWDNNPFDDAGQPLGWPGAAPAPGDIVIYITDHNGNGIVDDYHDGSHSATITEVDNDGIITEVISKPGDGQPVHHHPMDPSLSQYGTPTIIVPNPHN